MDKAGYFLGRIAGRWVESCRPDPTERLYREVTPRKPDVEL